MEHSIKYIREKLTGIYDQSEVESFSFLILNHITGLSKSDLIINRSDYRLKDTDFEKIEEIVLRLCHFEPIQYILGETEFYGLPFHVEPGVLIPRFETEELVDLIVKENSLRERIKILDIGCGSGCITVSLKKNIPSAEVWCCDVSEIALRVTRENALLNQVEINSVKYDVLGKSAFCETGYMIIVSNPPYVTNKEKEMMSRNVLDYEPEIALFVPDDDPLIFYRTIIEKSREWLLPDGMIYFEINESFPDEICQLMLKEGFTAKIIKDINGKDRIVKGTKQ